MWTVRSLLFLLLFWKAGVDCRNVEGLGRQEREKVNVTFSQTVALTKTIDTDKLSGLKPGPAQDLVKPPGCNQGQPLPIQLPQGPLLPVLDAPLPLMPNDGNAAVPPGTPEPPQFPGIAGPTMPPMPPIPTGIDIEVLEGESGGHLGDRCPDVMKDENGKFPDFCYDVIDENGACILDDIIAPKDDCIAWFGEDFYNELVETQKKIEENRTQALDEAGVSGTTSSPEEVQNEDPEEEADKIEAIEAEGRSVELEALPSVSRRNTQPVRRARPSLRQLARRDGPVMNKGVLDSLGYLETEQVGPTLGYFESLGRKKKDGPQLNMDTLNSLNYLQTELVGPTLGYFESLGRRKRSPADRKERGEPAFNVNALNSLEDSKNANSEGFSPDSYSWSNAIVLPDSGPSKP